MVTLARMGKWVEESGIINVLVHGYMQHVMIYIYPFALN